MKRTLILFVVLAACSCSIRVHAAEIIGLGEYATSNPNSSATGVSADGKIVSGRLTPLDATGPARPFRWSDADGWTAARMVSGATSMAWRAMSGGTIVGHATVSGENVPIMWADGQNRPSVLELPESSVAGSAAGISPDEGIVAGLATMADDRVSIVRWTEESGWQPEVITTVDSLQLGVVTNGTRMAGTFFDARETFVYDFASGEMFEFEYQGTTTGISDDGRTVVGSFREGDDESLPFRWTQETGMQVLPGSEEYLGDDYASSWETTDGALLLGRRFINGQGPPHGIGWSEEVGFFDLAERLAADHGLGNELSRWESIWAEDISKDERTLVGTGRQGDRRAEPIVIRLDRPLLFPPDQVFGDFNEDRQLTAADLDLLTQQILSPTGQSLFDLNKDDVVDLDDHRIWVTDIHDTWYGDANLDGEFNSGDLVAIFTVGKYETGQQAGWEEGDWNADGAFGTSDLVFAFQDGGYEQGPRQSVTAVPEPSSAVLLALATIFAVRRIRRTWV